MLMYIMVDLLLKGPDKNKLLSVMDGFILKTITGSWVFHNCLDNIKKIWAGGEGEKSQPEVSFLRAERPQLCCCREHTGIIFTSARAKLLDNSSQDR